MASSEAITRILWHAGLPFPASGKELAKGSMSTVTWTLVGVEETRDDLLQALGRLNLELNGSTPSEVGGSGKTNQLSRELVWGVERILHQMEEALEKCSDESQTQLIVDSIEMVKFWWRCILDGDIDDIRADWEA